MIEMNTKIGGIYTTASFRNGNEIEKFFYSLEQTGVTANNFTLIFDDKRASINATHELNDLEEQFNELLKRFDGRLALDDYIDHPVWVSESSIKIHLKVTPEKPTSYDDIFTALKPTYTTKEAELRNYFWDKQTQYIGLTPAPTPDPNPASTEETSSTEVTAESTSDVKPEICTEEDIEKYLADNLF